MGPTTPRRCRTTCGSGWASTRAPGTSTWSPTYACAARTASTSSLRSLRRSWTWCVPASSIALSCLSTTTRLGRSAGPRASMVRRTAPRPASSSRVPPFRGRALSLAGGPMARRLRQEAPEAALAAATAATLATTTTCRTARPSHPRRPLPRPRLSHRPKARRRSHHRVALATLPLLVRRVRRGRRPSLPLVPRLLAAWRPGCRCRSCRCRRSSPPSSSSATATVRPSTSPRLPRMTPCRSSPTRTAAPSATHSQTTLAS
mmetsp:Transcript_4569/g.16632  ORF Transcript_4569/g.16632 Transcript_4569/m.16632 type:complete len:260 (-) Transcript_4569:758-1537(-)